MSLSNQKSWIIKSGILFMFIVLFSFCKNTKLPKDNLETIAIQKETNDSLLNLIIAEGRKLFINNCSACHDILLRDKLIGPGLHGVTFRWSEFPKKDLYSWIKDSQGLISEGHPRALELWSKWQSVMVSFPLDDSEIEKILIFIEHN